MKHGWVSVMMCMVITGAVAYGEIRTETIDYRDGDVELAGYLAYDETSDATRPGVVVVHEWWGLTDHPKNSARALAELGYTAFALDMYGKGKRTDDPQQASAWSGAFRQDVDLAVQRFRAGLDLLASHPTVDGDHIAAIGYCFGGTIVLEMARAGVELDGVVSFHGGLKSRLETPHDIQAAVLVCHGADDPFVPADEVLAFQQAMRDAGADWQLNSYGGAVHSFTNPQADERGMDGVGYHRQAAERSWHALQMFLREIFKH